MEMIVLEHQETWKTVSFGPDVVIQFKIKDDVDVIYIKNVQWPDLKLNRDQAKRLIACLQKAVES